MKRNIAMVEDSEKDAKVILSHIRRFSKEKQEELEVTWYRTGGEFLSGYRHTFDIVLMDIQLTQLSGMDIARMLREIDNHVILIFITSLAQYAVEGYEVSALDFMVKPVAYPLFQKKMSRALSCCSPSDEKSILLKLREGLEYRTVPSRIRYLEIQSHDIIIHTTTEDLVAYGNLKQLEDILDPKSFVRCHRSYLVNLAFVTGVHSSSVLLDKDELPIAKLKKADFMQALNVYLREKS
ncbi:MAG: LytTR family transcriptional regulator DNA-binding domain-containing protein [Lachnospiraceae bacterium]|nr:LytTR family transcriptional regulator DNA-binding domain-containing protein [Lachnospiraceae bacterium]